MWAEWSNGNFHSLFLEQYASLTPPLIAALVNFHLALIKSLTTHSKTENNVGSKHSCGCYFDTYHLPQHCCTPSWQQYCPIAVGNLPCHTAKMSMNGLRNMKKSQGLQIPQISFQTSICGTCWTNKLRSVEAPPCNLWYEPPSARYFSWITVKYSEYKTSKTLF